MSHLIWTLFCRKNELAQTTQEQVPAGYKLDTTSYVRAPAIAGELPVAFTIEEDARINDGKIYVIDFDAYVDEATGNWLTPSDDPSDPLPEVLKDVLMDAEDNIYKFDDEATTQEIGGNQVVFTPDYFAFIDSQGNVYTPSGE